MSNKTIKIEEATFEQLKDYAVVALGMTIPGALKNKSALLAKIREVSTAEEIPVITTNGEVSGLVEPEKQEPVSASEDPDRIVHIFIEPGREDFGQEPVPVEVNGVKIWIPRGKVCPVKAKYAHVLFNAKMDVFKQDADMESPMESRKVLSYPVRLVDPSAQQTESSMIV